MEAPPLCMLWGSAIVALTVEMVEDDLAESDVMRGHFDIFVFLDIFELWLFQNRSAMQIWY